LTIAIKHQIRKLMADDQVKKAEAQARAESTDIPQMNVGPKRRTTRPRGYREPFAAVLEGASSTAAEQGLAKL